MTVSSTRGNRMDGSDLTDWLGRSETRQDVIRADIAERLLATLDYEHRPLGKGDPVPPLVHWCHFLPRDRQSRIGPDGHSRRGGFLPPVHHLPRRMWAGGRLSFPGVLRVGQTVERRSTIIDIRSKTGGSGELVFVTVRHEFSEADAGPVLLVEEHDIVYRGTSGPAVKPSETTPRGEWHRSLRPDAVMLFRYSALTFNGHRIHYDRDYATKQEGYPGLVVHGPLTATLLLDLVQRMLPEARIEHFSFRGVSPVFDGNLLHLNGTPPDAEGRIALWAADQNERLAMQAEAVVSR
jgi:3-methylfumaryl-CoA hydratase